MPDDDLSDDLNIQTPGDSPAAPPPPPPPPAPAAPAAAVKGKKGTKAAAAPPPASADDDRDARIIALELENEQLRAANLHLNDIVAEGAPAPREAAPKEVRLIASDWSSMTAAEAKAAGCDKTVLCRDGYYVPN